MLVLAPWLRAVRLHLCVARGSITVKISGAADLLLISRLEYYYHLNQALQYYRGFSRIEA
jgi:hypothetical protein